MAEGHQFDPTILREYDIRGIVPGTLAPGDVNVIGRAFGSIMLERGFKTAAVGYDGRLSSPQLEAALVEGLASTGVNDETCTWIFEIYILWYHKPFLRPV